MRDTADAPPGDGCDRMLANANSAGLTDRRRRFLAAYRERAAVAPAARLAGVHRATVYRWMADAGFVAAMRAAADEFIRGHRAKVLAEEEARQRWREARERDRRPMRVATLARLRGEAYL